MFLKRNHDGLISVGKTFIGPVAFVENVQNIFRASREE